MILKSKRTSVNAFSIETQAYIQNSKYIKDINNDLVVCIIEDANRILSFNNELIITDSLNKAYKKNGDLFLNERIIDIINNYILVYNKSPKYYAIYDNSLSCLFSESNGFGRQVFGKYIVAGIGDAENVLIRDISKNKIICSFKLESLGTWLDGSVNTSYCVAEFSGIYESTLACTMTNGAVLLLDIEKGEVKAFFKEAKVRGGIFQRENNDPIFLGLKHYTFIEINVETGELKRQVDIQNELKRIANIPSQSPCWLGVATSVFVDGLFYFIGDTNFVGVFDPVTEKIIDYHWFEFDKKQYQQLKGGIENLQIKDGKIYCLDTLSNLYELDLQPDRG